MTAGNGKPGADRAERGRFGPGNHFGRGRPVDSVTRELRRQHDPVKMAQVWNALLDDPSAKVRQKALDSITSRLEGAVVARSLSMTMTASTLLPPSFRGMSLGERRAALKALRERAVAGALAGGSDGSDDQDDQEG